MPTAIGERIRQERRRLGMSQAHLAHVIGISTTAMNDIETGKTPDPRGSRIHALADAFGVTTDYLFGRNPRPRRARPPAA